MFRQGSIAMIYHLTAALVLMAALVGTVGAQSIGPPISPQQQFDAQPKPRTQLPPSYAPPVGGSLVGHAETAAGRFGTPDEVASAMYAPPVGGSARTYSTPLSPVPQQRSSRGRAAECQHQATVDRVPRRQRGAYVRDCMMN